MAGAACAKIIIDQAAVTQGLMACVAGTATLLQTEDTDATMAEAEEFRAAVRDFTGRVNALLTAWNRRLGSTAAINPDIDF